MVHSEPCYVGRWCFEWVAAQRVVTPHTQDLDDPLIVEDSVDEPMLDVYVAQVRTRQIADQVRRGRRRAVRVLLQKSQNRLRLGLQADGDQMLV